MNEQHEPAKAEGVVGDEQKKEDPIIKDLEKRGAALGDKLKKAIENGEEEITVSVDDMQMLAKDMQFYLDSLEKAEKKIKELEKDQA